MSHVQNVFLCDARDEQGGLLHAPDCDQYERFVVQGKKQETKTGGKTKMPDHYRCTITCAFCGKRKHYEDECYHKQRLSAKLKSGAQSDHGSGRSKRHDKKGKRESQGRGKGQGQAQGKSGGCRGPDKKKQGKNQEKNQDTSRENPNPTPGRTNPEPSGGQQNMGPTTRSHPQAQQEQGTKRANEDGDKSNARKRSCFMRMAQKLWKKGFDVTCPAEF